MIGAGGVAEVYRAEHVDDHKSIAIKVMREERVGDKERTRGFTDEYRLLDSLQHTAIPKVRKLAMIKDRPAILMDYIPGVTLFHLHLDEAKYHRIGAMMAMVNVIAYLHEQNVLHNDIKLGNFILQPSGRLTLVDFGNARQIGRKGIFKRLFKRGSAVFGTATYLAPELILGGEPSPETDVYALGVCMWMMLAGSAPFTGDRTTKRLNRAVKEEAPRICGKVPQIPEHLGRIIDGCLARDPEARPASAVTLRILLRNHFEQSSELTPTSLLKILS